MKITFDPAKDETTRITRGLSLAVGIDVIRNQVATRIDARRNYGEERRIAYGHLSGRLHVCVYTVRGDELRIISVRKANSREVSTYDR
ncbi:MAG: BrnT family toxin [Mesorhizobium sp.]|nr:BrnT family toxin [Mesorhizobium sp.]